MTVNEINACEVYEAHMLVTKHVEESYSQDIWHMKLMGHDPGRVPQFKKHLEKQKEKIAVKNPKITPEDIDTYTGIFGDILKEKRNGLR